jgi:hypothetical protein
MAFHEKPLRSAYVPGWGFERNRDFSTVWPFGFTCAGHRKKIEANRQSQGHSKVNHIRHFVERGHPQYPQPKEENPETYTRNEAGDSPFMR